METISVPSLYMSCKKWFLWSYQTTFLFGNQGWIGYAGTYVPMFVSRLGLINQNKHRPIPNYGLFEWKWQLANFKIFGEFSSFLSFTVSFFKILSFLSLLVGFFRGKEERTSQHPNFLVGLTLLDMGFFEPSVMGGGGARAWGPPIITLLLLLRWSWNLAQVSSLMYSTQW